MSLTAKTLVVFMSMFLLNPNAQAGPKFDEDDLEKLTDEMIEKGEVRLPEISFYVNREDRTFVFSLDCKRPFLDSRPMDFPINLELLLETLEQNRKRLDPIKSSHRSKIRKLIDDQLELIEEHRGSKRELMTELLFIDERAREVVHVAVEDYAKRHQLEPSRTMTPCKAVFVSVEFVCKPNSARVFFLTGLAHRIESVRSKKLKRDTLASKNSWSEALKSDFNGDGIFRPMAQLTGRYVFRVVWPDGRRIDTGSVLVSRRRQITFDHRNAR